MPAPPPAPSRPRRPIIPHGHVVVTAGKITSVGPGPPPSTLASDDSSTVGAETGAGGEAKAPILSKPEHTLLPGLIDAHIHADEGDVGALEQSLRFGVTTVLDMHNEHRYVRKLLQLARDPQHNNIYADYKTCGVAATIPGGWPEPIVLAADSSDETKSRVTHEWAKLTSPADAPAYVDAQIAEGASYIKLMHEDGHSLHQDLPTPSRELQTAVVSAAHARGLMAVAHALSYAGTKTVLECGVDGLAHMFLDKPIQAEIVELYLGRAAHCNPTLACLGSLTGEAAPLQRRFGDEALATRMLLDPEARGRFLQCIGAAKGAGTLANAIEGVKILHKAGVPIVAGSDSAGPALGTAYGLSMHQELHMMCSEVGMDPVAALQTATSVPARRFGLGDRGFIEEGMNADLVLCEGDVVEFIRDKGLCLPIKGVWRNGVVAEVWKDIMT